MQNLATMKMSCFNVINAKQKHAKQERCTYSKAQTNAGTHWGWHFHFSEALRLLVPSVRLSGKLGDGIAKCVTSEKLRQVLKKFYFFVNSG
jgi:hypothetical protein